MMISGYNGEMDNQKNGNIIGKYTWRKDGRYEYSPQKYVVWDAEKNIWALKYAKNREIISPLSPLNTDSKHYSGKSLLSLINSTDSSVCCFFNQRTKTYYYFEFVNGRRSWNAYIFDPQTGEIGAVHQNAEVWANANLMCWEVYKGNETTQK